ncbi:MAG: hypothetical protein ACOYD7_07625 [Raoultibacter sp.]|jgi:hypothetical protein
MNQKKEYDWIDDPFKDDANSQKGMSRSSKTVVGLGCLLALVVMVVLFVGLFESVLALMEG